MEVRLNTVCEFSKCLSRNARQLCDVPHASCLSELQPVVEGTGASIVTLPAGAADSFRTRELNNGDDMGASDEEQSGENSGSASRGESSDSSEREGASSEGERGSSEGEEKTQGASLEEVSFIVLFILSVSSTQLFIVCQQCYGCAKLLSTLLANHTSVCSTCTLSGC